MIGTLDPTNRSVTVVGAGIAGLLAAYYLDRSGYEVTVIEKNSRAGGLIRTSQTNEGIAESAAHSLIATKTVLSLCNDLGVELVAPRKEAKAKYIVRHSKLSRFPLNPFEVGSALWRAATVRANGSQDQTLESWSRKHLGPAAHDYLLTPFVRGIYGVQPADLGVRASYPSLEIPTGRTLFGALLQKRKKESEGKEKKHRVAPKFGMGNLVAQLESHLQNRLGDRFQKCQEVLDLPATGNVVVATPATAAANLIEPQSPELAAQLRSIQYTPMVSVTSFVDRKSFTRSVEGVGVLMPACEERKCLGILFNSSSFENRVNDESRFASFTVMMGGTSQPSWLNASDDEIESAVQSELSSLLGITRTEKLVIHRWPTALPQYSIALPAIWDFARSTWCSTPGRILFGNYTGQISLRGMIESSATLGK